jgi:outer membrane lipopolysaccharide assembly protein LptE/RlpB
MGLNLKEFALLISLLAVLGAGLGCGYRLMGTTGSLPPHVKVVAVRNFERQVPVIELDQRVTEEVTRELARRAKVTVRSTKEGADAVMTGVITHYSVVPLSYDDSGRANRFQVNMTAKITLTESEGAVLFKSDGYRFNSIYERSSQPASYFNEETVAYEAVARDFARSLVGSLLEASGGKPRETKAPAGAETP